MEPGWGTMSSYRAEAAGVLSALVSLHGVVGKDVSLACDNRAVVSMFGKVKGTVRGEQVVRPFSSSDIWGAVAEWLRKWEETGWDFQLRWVRGHADTRKRRDEWDQDEWGNHIADAVAEAGYESRAEITSQLGGVGGWHMRAAGDRAYDAVKQAMEVRV